MKLRFGSICSGIEAASVAWEPLGWEPVFFSEIEKHPSNVLRYHWPDVPNLGDFTTIDGKEHDLDVLVGGTPCQAFSVAGRRQSLEDDRGNITLKFVELVHESNVPVVVWENVPGVLSTKDNAFGCFLAGLVGANTALVPLKDGSWPGFGMVAGPKRVVAWRVLDAQYFGVAQRRRRLFLVSFRAGDGRNPGAILFEPESMPRDTQPCREKGQEITPNTGDGASHWSGGPHPSLSQSHNSGGIGASNQEIFSQGGAGLVPVGFNWQNGGNEGLAVTVDGVGPLDCSQTKAIAFMPGQGSKAGSVAASEDVFPTLRAAEGGNRCPAIAIHPHCIGRAPSAGPQGKEYLEDGSAYTMDSRGVSQAVAIGWSEELTAHEDIAGTLQHGGQGGRHDGVMTPEMQVRRLTPVECERLQGFPDNHTQYAVDENGKQYTMPNGARYKALGNSMAVPCMAWIGRRIEMVLEATEYSKSVEESNG